MGAEIYQIDPMRCTECVGHYETPTCQLVCPIDNTIAIDPAWVESNEQLWISCPTASRRTFVIPAAIFVFNTYICA